ncbi:ThiF family adenylyltransferase [Paenibacillus sp. LHD-117]|uniref:HesA/MoeB/ThiF family protein n=1 Tax=Paenibacillus sp. LHD-117 TaxID=3071412 RepID=UPI0027DF3D85|nr:ThiF family adenylyltransferase [Paenibacillus sp. LHD-117]MDQ6422245.1 ThiF family adenylyltransferase [Paenibacillus sp. LHD-117]
MKNPALKPYCRQVMSRDNDVIRFKMERSTLEIDDPDGSIFAFIRLLDGARGVEEIASECRLTAREVEEGLALLDRHRLLACGTADPIGLTEREQIRYKNNLTYFSLYESLNESRFDFQKKLKNATVAVVGLGGGSVIAAWLAAMGVGRIVGVDFDRVELNNLNRQFFYTEDDVGEYKTIALQRRLHALNRDVKVEVHQRRIESAQSLVDIAAEADMMVSAIDTPPLMGSRYVNAACLHRRIPSYYLSIGNRLGFYFRVLPYESGCTDCRVLHIMRTDPVTAGRIRRQVAGAAADADTGNPGFAPNVAVMTALVASDIAKQLTGYSAISDMPFGLVPFHDMDISRRSIPRYSDCPSCGRSADPGTDEWVEPVALERLLEVAEEAAPLSGERENR